MARLLALLSLLLAVLSPQGADALAQHPPVSSFCSHGAGTPDGCGQSTIVTMGVIQAFRQPAGFQPGGYLNTVSGTQANYMATNCGGSGVGNGTAACRPPWNVAGIDYAIGNYTPCSASAVACGDPSTVCTKTTWDGTCLLDPALVQPPSCAYSATGNADAGPRLRCTAGGVLSHFDFGPVNGHNCTSLSLGGASSTPTVMDDVYFLNDSGACIDSINNEEWLRSTSGYTGSITVTNSVLDGNSYVFSTFYGSPGCIASLSQCNPASAIQAGASALTIKYSVVRNFPTATLHPGNAATIQYSWIEGWIVRSPNGHAEWFDGPNSGAVTNYTLDHNLWIENKFSSQNGPSPLFPASGWPVSIAILNLTNNVGISSFVGGLTSPQSTVTGCIGASFSGGACSGSGSTFFLTSGQAGWGNVLPGACAGFALGPPAPGTLPAGVISMNFIDGVNSGYGDIPGQVSQSFASCSGSTSAHSVSDGAVLAQHGPDPYGTVTIANNYFDTASFGAPGAQPIYGIGNTSITGFTGTITTTGGVSTLTSTSALNLLAGQYINGVGVDGCSIDVLHCPSVATAGNYAIGASIPITPAVTAVGPIGMTTAQTAGCSTPMAFSGNIDMAAQTSSAWMNQLSYRRDAGGC